MDIFARIEHEHLVQNVLNNNNNNNNNNNKVKM